MKTAIRGLPSGSTSDCGKFHASFFAAATQSFPLRGKRAPPSFLCSSQESSRRASARREESFQPKDLVWLDSCDEHRNEGERMHFVGKIRALMGFASTEE
ncbi:hypothetical protein F3P66_05585 [Agrobacterium fabrum]|nr:hypothetical protein F3P66_05585 [Agrobacterium fabrum]TRB26875.1 hypothetical protein EXN51_20465 [Agrobacterium fabrum]